MNVVNSSNLVRSHAASSSGGKRTKDPSEGVGISPYDRDKIDFAKNRGAKPQGGKGPAKSGEQDAGGAGDASASAPKTNPQAAPSAQAAPTAPTAQTYPTAAAAQASGASDGGAPSLDPSSLPPDMKRLVTLLARLLANASATNAPSPG